MSTPTGYTGKFSPAMASLMVVVAFIVNGLASLPGICTDNSSIPACGKAFLQIGTGLPETTNGKTICSYFFSIIPKSACTHTLQEEGKIKYQPVIQSFKNFGKANTFKNKL